MSFKKINIINRLGITRTPTGAANLVSACARMLWRVAASVTGTPVGGRRAAGITLLLLVSAPLTAHGETNVTTHHNDVSRTGWNSSETVLTPTNVGSSFGSLATATLDDQVDGQPLIATNVAVSGQGQHNVVYVVTENDSVYGLDASTGKQLLFRNFGTPIPASIVKNCNNNPAHIGINSTPVIDPTAGRLYLIAETYEGSPLSAVYRVHALRLTDLSDAVPAVTISASDELTNGKTYNFQALYSRQRSALLEWDGNIYAGFSSHCDLDYTNSRGWLLGWNASTLSRLDDARLDNINGSAPHNFFLTSIWMSGAGPAADTGGVYFVTANSDPTGQSYSYTNNLENSVIKMWSSLESARDSFTPSDNAANPSGTGTMALDKVDNDFGAGGVLIVPTQSGPIPHLATAAGKSGYMYLLNRDSLGGHNSYGANKVVGSYYIGPCWCAQSYYVGSDGVGRIVSSGGLNIETWKILTSSSNPTLAKEYTSASLNTTQDPGVFTSVSSNGTSGTVIWTVSRADTKGHVSLYAFDPAQKLKTIYTTVAGTWPYSDANANIVPTVANGKVYVASYKELNIFGIKTNADATEELARPLATATTQDSAGFVDTSPVGASVVTGVAVSVKGTQLTLRKRDDTVVEVDAEPAVRAEANAVLVPGTAFTAAGKYDSAGILHAQSILRAKPSQQLWPVDR